jgi:hypothetical protein
MHKLLISCVLALVSVGARAQTLPGWPDQLLCPAIGPGMLTFYPAAMPAAIGPYSGKYVYVNPYWGNATSELVFNPDGSHFATVGPSIPTCAGPISTIATARNFAGGSVAPVPPAPITLNPTKTTLGVADFTGGWVIVNNPIAQGLLLPAASATGQAPGAKLVCFSVEGSGPLQLTVPAGSGWFTGAGTSPTQTALQTASFCLWSDETNYHIAGGAP